MATDFGKYMTSHLFTFVIGPQGKEITVHSGPLASLSAPLNNLINGKLLEANNRRADWSEVKEDTFFRLCEYAYVRDFTPPACYTIIHPEEAVPTECLPEPVNEEVETASPVMSSMMNNSPFDPWGWGQSAAISRRSNPASYDVFNGHRVPCHNKGLQTSHLRNTLSILESELKTKLEQSPSTQRYIPVGNSHPAEDFDPVFLGHTELYVLADKYDIASLKDLVLYKLVRTLSQFTLCQGNVSDVAEWVRYAYQSTLPRDPLRKLAIAYVVSHLGELGGSESLKELLDEGGDFVVDFWEKLWKP